jgi:hypothetical protein
MKNKRHVFGGTLLGMLMSCLIGCGGGGGGDDDDGPSLAPQELGGKSVTMMEANAPVRIWNFSSGGGWDEFENGTRTRSGTYQYSPSGNNATLLVRDAINTNETINLNLVFTSGAAGNYTYTTSPTQASGTGTFSNLTNTPGPNPNDPGGNNPGGGTGLAPASLAGKLMDGTRTQTSTGPAGQTHTYTFTATTFTDVDADERGTGDYTYTPNGNEAILVLDYTASEGPRDLRGDQHTLTLTFTSATGGSFRSSYRSGNETILIDGVFSFQ